MDLDNQKEIIPLFKPLFVFDYRVGRRPKSLPFAEEKYQNNGWGGGWGSEDGNECYHQKKMFQESMLVKEFINAIRCKRQRNMLKTVENQIQKIKFRAETFFYPRPQAKVCPPASSS